ASSDAATAIENLRKAESLSRSNPPIHALAQARLAMQLHRLGRDAEAGVQWRESLDYYARHAAEHPDRAIVLGQYGKMLTAIGQTAQAARVLEQADRLATAQFPAGHWRLAQISAALGENLVAQGQGAQGLVRMQQAHADLRTALGQAHPESVRSLARLTRAQQSQP
ncbi:MAG: hypothetical protein ABIP49_08575, partial [Lysobacterales bacterium]